MAVGGGGIELHSVDGGWWVVGGAMMITL